MVENFIPDNFTSFCYRTYFRISSWICLFLASFSRNLRPTIWLLTPSFWIKGTRSENNGDRVSSSRCNLIMSQFKSKKFQVEYKGGTKRIYYEKIYPHLRNYSEKSNDTDTDFLDPMVLVTLIRDCSFKPFIDVTFRLPKSLIECET